MGSPFYEVWLDMPLVEVEKYWLGNKVKKCHLEIIDYEFLWEREIGNVELLRFCVSKRGKEKFRWCNRLKKIKIFQSLKQFSSHVLKINGTVLYVIALIGKFGQTWKGSLAFLAFPQLYLFDTVSFQFHCFMVCTMCFPLLSQAFSFCFILIMHSAL